MSGYKYVFAKKSYMKKILFQTFLGLIFDPKNMYFCYAITMRDMQKN